MNVMRIAMVCHETNRAYCESIGDLTQPHWQQAPEWQRASAVKGVEFHLAAHQRGEKPSASASHESWLEEKRRDGWTYGAVKDAERKQHPCFVPYDELPLEQRMKDYLFGAVVEAFIVGAKEPVAL